MAAIRVGFSTPVYSLDPHHAQDYVGGQIIEQLYEAPYRQDGPDQAPHPVLFTGPLEREPDAGGKTRCIARLRPGLRFSDGSPVTAREVVDSLRLAQPIAARAEISGVGDRIELVLEENDPRLEAALSRRWCSIVLRRGDRILGTGPYAVCDGWTPEHIRITRNPHAQRHAHIDEIEFRVYPRDADGSPQALKQALVSGEVDFTTSLGRDDVGDLKNVRKVFQPGSSTAILYLNVQRPALLDIEVRRAITECIDRPAVAAVTYSNPHAFVARSLLPPSMWRHGDRVRHDPIRARQRMISSGQRPARPLSMLMMWGPRPYLPQPERTASLLIDQLGQIGLEVRTIPTADSIAYGHALDAGDYDLVLSGWMADTPDPYDFLAATLHSACIPAPGGANASANNLSRYRSQTMDDRLDRYRRSGRADLLEEIMAQLSQDFVLCPLFYGPSIVVHAWRLRDIELSHVGIPQLADAAVD
jgi:ABC-type transport system substrate-binding protein